VGNYTYSMGGSPTAPAHYGALIAGLLGFAQWDLQIPSGIVPAGTTAAVPVVITDVASGAQTPSGVTIWASN
jgi:L-serine deaminase